MNQLLNKTLPGSQVTSYLYDQVGNLTRVTDPDSVLAMSYDQANRLMSVTTEGSSNQPTVSLAVQNYLTNAALGSRPQSTQLLTSGITSSPVKFAPPNLVGATAGTTGASIISNSVSNLNQ